MRTYIKLQPNSKNFLVKVTILKTMMYCGVLWGLYHPKHQGWAIKSENSENYFPFWLNSIQAIHYAKAYWPEYVPKKITPRDFQDSLLPTLNRLEVKPALFNHKVKIFKLTTLQMRQFFFSNIQTA